MNLKPFLTLFFTLGIATLGFAQITLPVEVLGAEGTIESRIFDLTANQATSAKRLWMQINNLSYEGKASVRINGGDWEALNHASVDMQQQEKLRGGMTHGGFNTIRLSIPATNFFSDQPNTVDFKFNLSDGISIGYRVVKFNILDASGQSLMGDEMFTEDDPNMWTAPIGANAANGEVLWSQRNILWNHYLETTDGVSGNGTGKWYGHTLPAKATIKASCADCHAQDGRDLELFAYSNLSIIERAKFHRLTEQEGEDIAAYIRSLSGGTPESGTINRSGRPWNPPFQPGPLQNNGGANAEFWHAGAGLDAVLDKDADMLPHLFKNAADPNNPTQQEINGYFDHQVPDVDRTTLPVALQLPDWKHWLPLVHPMDGFDKNGDFTSTYNNYPTKRNPLAVYEHFRAFLEGLVNTPDGKIDVSLLTESQKRSLVGEHRNYHHNHRHYLDQDGGTTGSMWRTQNGNYINDIKNNLVTFTITSMARLMAVKNFEIMQEFGLQNQMQALWATEDYPNQRQWLNGRTSHNVFEIPAHFTGEQDSGGAHHYLGQDQEVADYETTAWYHLQAVLAGGEGQQWFNGPVDNNYQEEYVLRSGLSSGIMEPIRYYHYIATMYKTKSWSKGAVGYVDPNDVNGFGFEKGGGFTMRQQGPWIFFGKEGDAGPSQFWGHAPGTWVPRLDQVQAGLSTKFLNALILEFLEVVEPIDLTMWHSINVDSGRGHWLETNNGNALVDVESTGSGGYQNLENDHVYWAIKQAVKYDVDCAILERLIDWSKAAWPAHAATFEALKTSDLAPQLSYEFIECDTRGYQASVTGLGDNPSYVWLVNDAQASTASFLPESTFTQGDQITITVTGSTSCSSGVNQVSDQFTAPTPIPICVAPSDSAYYPFEGTDFLKNVWEPFGHTFFNGGNVTQQSEGGDRGDVAVFGENQRLESSGFNFEKKELTIEAWINLNLDRGKTQRVAVFHPGDLIRFEVNSQGKLEVYVKNGSVQKLTMIGSLTNGAWSHVVTTISKDEVKLYVNGEFNTSTSLSFEPLFASSKTLVLGFSNTTLCLEGKVDDVKIHNRVLSAQEISTSYTGIVTPTVDKIVDKTGFDVVVPGQTYPVTVDYEASQSLDFVVFLQEVGNNYPIASNSQSITVTPGSGSFTLNLTVLEGLPASIDKHRWVVQMTPSTGGTMVDDFVSNVDVDASLSVFDNELKTSLKVYPNPTDNNLNIVIGEKYIGLNANIVDLSGRVIMSQELNNVKNTLDLSLLSEGVYMLVLKDKSDKITSVNKVVLSR